MAFSFDHAIIAVNDLDAAMRNYEALGFTVMRGGEHASGSTHNALICFSDGTYLELLAATGRAPQPGTTDFSPMLRNGEGFVGYALYSDDLAADIAVMRARGIPVGDPQPGRRLRPDGVELRWQSATINGSMAPFFIQDETPRAWRVPESTHLNGVFRMTGVYIVTPDLDAGAQRFTNLLNLRAERLGVGASLYRYFTLGGLNLYLSAPNDNASRQHYALHGDAPYEIHLETYEELSPIITPEKLHHARIQIWAG
ncbi:MAG: VOC family protein [Anaerolineae bacterium]